MAADLIQLGEAFAGAGPEAAHLNTLLGARDGVVGQAFATALATPRAGHVAFVVAAQPGLAVRPHTLFVNKSTITTDAQAALAWGPAQAGVAAGVLDAVADGTIPPALAEELVCIAAVWVAPKAADADAVFASNREATAQSLRNGAGNRPSLGEVLAVRDEPFNAYWLPPSLR